MLNFLWDKVIWYISEQKNILDPRFGRRGDAQKYVILKHFNPFFM